MLKEYELANIGTRRIKAIFGQSYLNANRAHAVTAYGFSSKDEYLAFVALKDKRDLPNHPASAKGWTVYAEIRIDAETGKIKREDYKKE